MPVPLFDPESVPLDPHFEPLDVRGAPFAQERLQPEALRARFADPPIWHPEVLADAGRYADRDAPIRTAAVLVPLIARAGGSTVLFTRRSANLPDHPGQISFPGGRTDPGDRDAVHTALREAREEIGLPAVSVDVIGQLPAHTTSSRYLVTPVVGLIGAATADAGWRLDLTEVDEVFEVPLAHLMNPRNHERRLVRIEDRQLSFYAIAYHGKRRYFIWGATAAMLRNLYRMLQAG